MDSLQGLVLVLLCASVGAYETREGFLERLSALENTPVRPSGPCTLVSDLKNTNVGDKLKTNGVFLADKDSDECKKLRHAYDWLSACIRDSASGWGNGPCSGKMAYDNMNNKCATLQMMLPASLHKKATEAATRCKALNPTAGAMFGCVASCGTSKCANQCLRHSFLAMCGVEGRDDSWSPTIFNPPGENIPPPKPAVPVPGSIEGKSKDEINAMLCRALSSARIALDDCNKANVDAKDPSVFMKCFKSNKDLEGKLPIWKVIEKRAAFMKKEGKGATRLTQDDIAKCFAKCYAERTDGGFLGRLTGIGARLNACYSDDCIKGSFVDVCPKGKAWEPEGGWPDASL